MTVSATARERRASRRAWFSRELTAAASRLGVSDAQIARMVGTARQKVSKWRDEEDPQLPQASDIPAMGKAGVELLRKLAEEMGFVLAEKVDAKAPPADTLRLVSDMTKENGDVAVAFLDGLGTHGGRFTEDELERIDRELLEAEQVNARARLLIDQPKAEAS